VDGNAEKIVNKNVADNLKLFSFKVLHIHAFQSVHCTFNCEGLMTIPKVPIQLK
jgi:hypothetical protein